MPDESIAIPRTLPHSRALFPICFPFITRRGKEIVSYHLYHRALMGSHSEGDRYISLPIGTRFKRLFSIDLRSLAVFRIALGVLLLADLSIRVQDLSAHYTDWGALPRDVTALFNPLHMSVHLVTGSSFGQATIFLIAGVFALALLLGFRTPLVTCASWLLLLSVQARNPRLLHSSDDLLRLLLFWGMFVPLGARYSLDSLIRRSGPDGSPLPTSVSSVGTAALLLQVCLVYWCTAALKSWDVWWHEASAVYYTLHIDQIVTPFGLWLLGFPELLALLSRATIVLEFFGPCLVFVPFFTPWLRLVVIGASFSFHIGLALCMSIGAFPYVSMVSWLVFVPSLVWERGRRLLLPRSSQEQSSPALPPVQASRWAQALAAFLLVYVVVWNLLDLPATSAYARQIFPPYAGLVGHLLRLDQRWDMFSPYPLRGDGWFVMPGTLRDGSRVDVWTDRRGISWDKPSNVSAQYPNDRWWKFMERISGGWNREAALDAYARYVCREWNTRHDGQERLETFQIFFMQETTPPDPAFSLRKTSLAEYHTHTVRPEKRLLGTHSCSEQS